MTRITDKTAADLAAFQALEDHPTREASELYPHGREALTYREALASAEVEDVTGYTSPYDGTAYAYAVTVTYAREGWAATYGVTPDGATVLWAD